MNINDINALPYQLCDYCDTRLPIAMLSKHKQKMSYLQLFNCSLPHTSYHISSVVKLSLVRGGHPSISDLANSGKDWIF